MASAAVLVLLAVLCRRCAGEPPSQHFGDLLKPPPPPLPHIVPVPFHNGGRSQRQNLDVGYHYPPPPPPAPQQLPHFPSDFKLPAPFYKQYNFNFVPPPQPFSTTPSPSLFQKVSTWLFPSQQTNYDNTLNSGNVVKKDCNPCNLVPWIPVLKYNVGAKNVYQSSDPTYGPPSPTALADSIAKYHKQSIQNAEQRPAQLSPAAPHAVYGPPLHSFNNNNHLGAISSTYGPPSPTHTYGLPSPGPLTSTFIPSSPYSISTTYGAPSSSIGQPLSSYLPSQDVITPFNPPTTTYRPPVLYTTPSPSYGAPLPVTTYGTPITSYYDPGAANHDLRPQNDVELINNADFLSEQQLPKVTEPTGFRNSYGEPISNSYGSPYPVSATAAESNKVKTEVLPNGNSKPFQPNISLAVGNPAPFTLNRGRNIHTLQPVALPNLSVSPLPPIFNARPFRPAQTPFPPNILQGINQMQQKPNNVDITKSVPLAEYTHSVDYPTTFIQSPVIDFDILKTNNNHTKSFRHIPNHFVIDEIRDISSQASEDHLAATKNVPDSSFESTGADVGNDIYDIPSDLKESSYVPTNHKTSFADLRGLKDADVDKYRTENNLQNIDSPLLYLKPSAPHKGFGNFVIAVSTPVNDKDFEIYDDVASTPAPQIQNPTAWDESRTDYSEGIPPPPSLNNNNYQPKIVQIIVPYTTGKKEQNSEEQDPSNWVTAQDENQPRKIPANTESPYSQYTETYSTIPTTTEDALPTVTDNYSAEKINTAAILNDLYDVKEPPFDIIKLQHTIDDWTEQEYSKFKEPQRIRNSEKYAKKIPDEFFTTTAPTNFVTESNYYEIFDHEGSSSIQHAVTDDNDTFKPVKEYNTIERTKNKHTGGKKDENEDQKPHIYTAASSFRTTTTMRPVITTTTSTPAPWGKIQTSISPLTKEKVYVVTSKPWRDPRNMTKEWFEAGHFESKKTSSNSDSTTSDSMPFRSPRFMSRPSFGFTSGGKIESMKSDSSYDYSRSWYQSINALENNSTSLPEQRTASDEVSTTVNRHKH